MSDDLDPVVAMRDHQPCAACGEPAHCLDCAGTWPCLSYRLAEALAKEQGEREGVEPMVRALVSSRDQKVKALAYLREQYERLLAVHEHVVMDTPEDRELHEQVMQTFRDALNAIP